MQSKNRFGPWPQGKTDKTEDNREQTKQTKQRRTASLCCHFKSRNYSVAITAMRVNTSES